MQTDASIENLFRRESGKLIAVLTKVFGPHNLQLAEDVMQDSLVKAMEHWKFHGVPENPSAWLFTVARNKALDIVRREKHQKEFSTEVSRLLKSEYSAGATINEIIAPTHIEDEQLRMMFVCCHPSIPEEGQVALVLKTLCGFSTAEIARAFLTNEENITKRLYRAKELFRQQPVLFDLPPAHELVGRLENVLTAVYLIFNEGYHSASDVNIVREELIEESLRLCKMLADHPLTQLPNTQALLALMCFNAARALTRIDSNGRLLQLHQQNRSLWNSSLIEQGNYYLNRASRGTEATTYHIEAAIAYEHCSAASYEETNWQRIVELYDWLYTLRPMPLIQLNQLIAYAEWKGVEAALEKISKTKIIDQLQNQSLLFATLGEWHARAGNENESKINFEKAHQLSSSESERLFFANRLQKFGVKNDDAC